MKHIILLGILVIGVVIGFFSIEFIINSNLEVMKIFCDKHDDQMYELAEKMRNIRLLQKETTLRTDEYDRLEQEFQKLTDDALERKNWYIGNCVR